MPRISLARDHLREQPRDDLVIHRRPHRQDADLAVGQSIAILGRHRRAAHEAAARILDEIVEKELRRLLHHRIRARQERAIGREQIVFPQVLREPRRAGGPQSRARQITRRREAPDVGDVMRHEPARAVVHARGLAPGLAQRFEEIEQRLVQLGEVGHLGRPVVHLQVDVEVIVRIPRRAHAVVPQRPAGWPADRRDGCSRSTGSGRTGNTGRRAPGSEAPRFTRVEPFVGRADEEARCSRR